MKAEKGEVKVITGNAAAAHGARLCRPDVATSYPITPMSEVAEALSAFRANGLMDTDMVEVEGENSAMNVVAGASLAGGRVFTATSSWGLSYMYDAVQQAAGFRAPIVMVIANRESPGILAVSGGQQDIISVRDSGWLQVIVEEGQEILDTVIMAYRLAEDYDIQLPVMVNYDGFYLSYMATGIEIPRQEDVDAFLAPLKQQPARQILEPGEALGCGTHGMDIGFVELRYRQMAAMERAADKLDEIDAAFGDYFGRSYGGQIDTYRLDDAEIALVTSGSATGTARVVVDQKRAEGIKVGLVKLRLFRPFPRQKLAAALNGKKAIGVIDRSVGFGWNCGPMYMEIRALTPEIGIVPMLSYIDGLANLDITASHIERIVDEVAAAARGETYQETTWLPLEV
jgi:pyruvate ferredoxin oxidoreductase alpha subunit